ncbi:Spo0E family sporulation regulatory protein-aspartic acid phosphatase [Actinomycetes bacterium NPDC127524]|jgi:hypothetical protein|uniref:aspartyl-phosphate phosphatase Spo0E family protein n=1 Tax=Bacillaceae TaxID=186817 RepID=UPI0009F24B05|nr:MULTISPECIES: aspartyl-phosphate phosphatase Spo0E family protein [unclassified Bacillus (in: firmicutes)]
MTAKQLLHHIEECRQRMIHLALSSSRIDTQVVKASTELDQLINQYYRITKKQ